MKLIVLNWFKDIIIPFIGRAIELLFRIILACLPLGLFLLMLQLRNKASKVSSLSVYTKDESTWQHIFPGFILLTINPTLLKDSVNITKKKVQIWIESNKYLLAFLFMTTIVFLMIIGGQK